MPVNEKTTMEAAALQTPALPSPASEYIRQPSECLLIFLEIGAR